MSEPATGPWLGASLLAAVGATTVEAALIQVKYRSFTGGFLNPVYLDGAAVPLFVAASLLLDAAAVALFVAPALWLTRRLAHPGRRLVMTAGLAAIPWAACTIARFELLAFARDWLGYRFGWGPVPAGAVVAVLLGGAIAAPIWLGRFVPARVATLLGCGSASRRRALIAGVALVVGALLTLAVAGYADRGFQRQMLRKTSGTWGAAFARATTDFDGDGYDIVRQPADFAPFDGARHPWAKDVPGNGIDENGVGGDLPPWPLRVPHMPPVKQFVRKPDVLLIVLETFRADNLTAEVDGKPVTPVLRGLIAKGALTGTAYTHSAYTVPSLTHLFTGTMHPEPSTLIDDFNRNGYVTAVFSGQDESFGGIEDVTGGKRAHVFVDARHDVLERTTASANSGSLTVPWQVVLRNVRAHLKTHAATEKPLFAYVNFQDAHFPYVHRRTERLLTDDLVSRGEMRPRHAARILRTYRNAAANVDKAVGELLAAWRAARGRDAAFVIVSDHGENIYENGMLGHGIALSPLQMRIAFVAGGLPMACTFPLGHSEVRSLLRAALTDPDARASARTDPDRSVWQYVGSIGSPQQVGAAWAAGGVVFDLLDDEWSSWGVPRKKAPYPHVLHVWEHGAYR